MEIIYAWEPQVDIYEKPDDECEVCGDITELRPYGRNGEWICVKCAMFDLKTTQRKFYQINYGQDLH